MKREIFPGEYYHIFNRGNYKQDIFLDERDRVRFLFLVLHLQSLSKFYNIGRQVTYYVKHRMFNIIAEKIEHGRVVELVAFSLMPNHFHLIIKEVKKGGAGEYMRRIQDAYTKYFNTKYNRSGHLLSGPYRAIHIKDNRQLLYLSTYIHRNPRELSGWRGKEVKFPWSSFQDFLKNRWGSLLATGIILKQFSDAKGYRDFVNQSTAKTRESLDADHLI